MSTLHIPNMTVIALNSKRELSAALKYAMSLNSPVCIRYSKSCSDSENVSGYKDDAWQVVKDGRDLTVIAVGKNALNLALCFGEKYDKSVKVVSARVIKPLDSEMLLSVKTPIITIEENVVSGGFGAFVASFLAENNPQRIYPLGVKDKFIKHGSIEEQLVENGFTVENLTVIADRLLNKRKGVS